MKTSLLTVLLALVGASGCRCTFALGKRANEAAPTTYEPRATRG